MASKAKKWIIEKQNPDDPLYGILFVSRNKDNGYINENYKQRRNSFLYHLKSPIEIPDSLMKRFDTFCEEGVDHETSRMYVSVNNRDPAKIRQGLMHMLIDDNMPTQTPLCHMDAVITSIAMKNECKADKKWLFDFDIENEDTLNRFIDNINNIIKADEGWSEKYFHDNENFAVSYETPHGYGVICKRGFDIRKLDNEFKEMIDNKLITLIKDGMLCVHWHTNINDNEIYDNISDDEDEWGDSIYDLMW